MGYVICEDKMNANPVRIHNEECRYYIGRKINATTMRWHGPYNTYVDAISKAKFLQKSKGIDYNPKCCCPKNKVNKKNNATDNKTFRNSAENQIKSNILQKFFIHGSPVGFANSGEDLWKNELNKNIPVNTENIFAKGVIVNFHLKSFLSSGQQRDLDNLMDPVFSILVNKKRFFSGVRTNIFWWMASKIEREPTGCEISLFSEFPSEEFFENVKIVLEKLYPGPLPISGRDEAMIQWAQETCKEIDWESNDEDKYELGLKFGNQKLNIGEVPTGPVKSTIDCLYPFWGGTKGYPFDWKILRLKIEKGIENIPINGVLITIGKI